MKASGYAQMKRFDAETINRLKETDEAALIDSAERAYEDTVRQTVERYLERRKEKGMILISGLPVPEKPPPATV
jgi:hypothetical protein